MEFRRRLCHYLLAVCLQAETLTHTHQLHQLLVPHPTHQEAHSECVTPFNVEAPTPMGSSAGYQQRIATRIGYKKSEPPKRENNIHPAAARKATAKVQCTFRGEFVFELSLVSACN